MTEKKKKGKAKWIVLVLVVIVAFAAFSGGGSESPASAGTPEEPEVPVEYTVYDASELINDLESNALAASEKYKEQYIEVTGELSVIDSSGSYISISSPQHPFSFTNIQCYIQNDEQKQIVAGMSIGQTVTVKGQCTDVGELLGYSMDIDEIA